MEHKLISGGEKYLPFARSRIKALRATGLTYASQQFEFPDGSVKVRIEVDHEYITLGSGGEVGYEFFTTGAAQPGAAPITGHSVYAKLKPDGTVLAVPKGSTLEQPSTDPNAKQWPYSTDPLAMEGFMPHRGIWQVDAQPEHTYYPGQKPDRVLINSWSQAAPTAGIGVHGCYGSPYDVDTAYDVAPVMFKPKKLPTAGDGGKAPDSDWYRRAALRKVTSTEFGDRWFTILTDVSGHFHVYPTAAAPDNGPQSVIYDGQAVRTNIPQSATKTLRAPFPAWVDQPPLTLARDNPVYKNGLEMVKKYPQYLWAFNSTATRCAAVVFKKLPVTYWEFSEYGHEVTPPPGGPFPPYEHYRRTTTYPVVHAGTGEPAQESLPGLLELSIDIQITGAGDGDFTFVLDVVRQIDPQNDYVMATDYAWEIPGKPVAGVSKDDLLIMTFEVKKGMALNDYTTQTVGPVDLPSDYTTWTVAQLEADALLQVGRDTGRLFSRAVVKNLDTNQVLRTIVGEYRDSIFDNWLQKEYARQRALGFQIDQETGSWFNLIKGSGNYLLSYDLRVLAFAIRSYKYTYDKKEVSTRCQVTRSDALTVIMNNVVAHTEVLSGGGASADIQTNGTVLDKLAPGAAPSDIMSGSALWWQANGDVSFTLPAGHTYNTDPSRFIFEYGVCKYPSAAALYCIMAGDFLQNRHHNAFVVHPDGHWAVSTGTAVYYGGATYTTLSGAYFSSAELSHLDYTIYPSALAQGHIDIVSFQKKNKDGSFTDVRTSHRELYNQAYGKSLTKADFKYYELGVAPLAYPGGTTKVFATISSPAIFNWAGYIYCYDVAANGNCTANVNLAEVDGMRFVDPKFMTLPPPPWSSGARYPAKLPSPGPILSGSGLFTGKTA